MRRAGLGEGAPSGNYGNHGYSHSGYSACEEENERLTESLRSKVTAIKSENTSHSSQGILPNAMQLVQEPPAGNISPGNPSSCTSPTNGNSRGIPGNPHKNSKIVRELKSCGRGG
ncbi:uncharacterized protein [Marmota flaviventris]|uniref:uncharacterized protein isoform X2 n=1 Tax=Marmota flaviventris TaxID=93162 RepID=UPI003A861583